jgi:hypothetical protein
MATQMNVELYSFKIQGQTAADAAIATVAVSYRSDGSITFTIDGQPGTINIHGNDSMSRLVKAIFTGTGGIDAGSSGVQGHRVFAVETEVEGDDIRFTLRECGQGTLYFPAE